MGKLIQNAIKLPSVFIGLISDLNRQKKFMKHHILPILNSAKKSNDGTLTDKDFLKINSYYGFAVPAILGEAFCILRGVKMTETERWVSTCQGAITGLFDDFFDDLKLPEEKIVTLVNNPEYVIPSSSIEGLFLDFYKIALQESAFPDIIKKQLLKVHKAQVASVEQENLKLNPKRIWDITCLKGGDSVLFYRSAYDNIKVEGEEFALYQLGSLMQFENDIFDIYKDFKGGIATLATTTARVEELRTIYISQLSSFIKLCYRMDYPREKVSQFLDRIMPVLNRGFVCLDSYKQLESSNGVFDVSSFTRKQLICDMEKPGNFIKTIWYQLKSTY